MTAPPLPYRIGVSVDPRKRHVLLWIEGAPLALSADQARIVEGLLREARLAVEPAAEPDGADCPSPVQTHPEPGSGMAPNSQCLDEKTGKVNV